MSVTLFLDTTVNANIGLYQDEKFIYLDRGSEEKASHKFHYRVYEMLKENNLSIKEIDNVFQMAGPGSYTGMRLSEGFSHILELSNLEIYSLYHFEVPLYCGVKNYTFISNAFKKEFFIAQCDNGTIKKMLVNQDDFVTDDELYSIDAIDSFETLNTLDLIEKNPIMIKKCINSHEKREIYYYRALEEEFKMKEKQL